MGPPYAGMLMPNRSVDGVCEMTKGFLRFTEGVGVANIGLVLRFAVAAEVVM